MWLGLPLVGLCLGWGVGLAIALALALILAAAWMYRKVRGISTPIERGSRLGPAFWLFLLTLAAIVASQPIAWAVT